MNKDITFCTHKDCCAFDCIRHISQLEDKTLVSMADMYDEDFCPPQPGEVKKKRMNVMNIKESTCKWVSEFNAVPTAMIERLVMNDEAEWEFYLPDGDDEPIPMWGSMWSFDDWTDNEWIESYGGLDALLKCGFTVLHHDEFGYFFGINGAGYNFYDAHWIPLYKARGLQWHNDVV